MKILILCTGNSCRSQMAEGFLKTFDSNLIIYSAGTSPSSNVHPIAIEVMNELKISLAQSYPKLVNEYLNEDFDFVITVCGEAEDTCPSFSGKVNHNIHIGFDDPAETSGTEDEIRNEFRRIRDEILVSFFKFYQTKLKP